MMKDRYANSRRLFERASKSIAAGVNSGIRKMEQPVPLYFQRGDGTRVWDVDGNEYIDFQIGQGALLYGHAPAGMAEAIAAQAKLGTHWAAQSELEIEVAERTALIVSWPERCELLGELRRANHRAIQPRFVGEQQIPD